MLPELQVRSLVHKLGYRFRLHRKDLPGTPDLTFPLKKKVIFVHGCFWHAHGCMVAHTPQSNKDYWSPKLTRNAERDAEHLRALQAQGWRSLVLWECELDLPNLERRLKRFLL